MKWEGDHIIFCSLGYSGFTSFLEEIRKSDVEEGEVEVWGTMR